MKRNLIFVFLLVAMLFAFTACDGTKEAPHGNDPSIEGTYYCDTPGGGGEDTIKLYDAFKFDLKVNNATRSGVYTREGEKLTLTVTDSKGAATSDVIVATYKDRVVTIGGKRYLEQINYTVTYSGTGVTTAPALVMNGKIAQKPAKPIRDGYIFVGWFNQALTEEYKFTKPVTASMTLYAFWISESTTHPEFTVSMNLNYTDADALEPIVTVDNKLYVLIDDPVRPNHEFMGWWVSMYNDPDKLSYCVTLGMDVWEDITVYALWREPASGSKLQSPAPTVEGNFVRWEQVASASQYRVEITAIGFTAINQQTNALFYNAGFLTSVAGEYTIKVTALSALDAENNSDSATRYYKNRMLSTVSNFEIDEDNTIIFFNKVKFATGYFITVVCGNPAHSHINLALGIDDDGDPKNYYNFSDCPMLADGIKFTVTARANTYVESVSATQTFERTLPELGLSSFAFDEETAAISWIGSASAKDYSVSIECTSDKHTHEILKNITATTCYIEECDKGQIKITVTPHAFGWNSPAPTQYVFNKVKLATPQDVRVEGDALVWDAVKGAKSYTIKINDSDSYTTTDAQLSGGINLIPDQDNAVIVMAVGETAPANSRWSKVTDVRTSMSIPTYAANAVSWSFVFGAQSYQVKINDGVPTPVDGNKNKLENVYLTKERENVISVCYISNGEPSAWQVCKVDAFKITYNSQGGDLVTSIYVANGDKIILPTDTRKTGHNLKGWYLDATAEDALDKSNDGNCYFTGSENLTIYAHWTVKNITVNFSGSSVKQSVTYGSPFDFEVPDGKLTTDGNSFIGWYDKEIAPDGDATVGTDLNVREDNATKTKGARRVTNELGNGIGGWTFGDDDEITVYPFWGRIFIYSIAAGTDTYSIAVDRDWDHGRRSDLVTHMVVPIRYNGKLVTHIFGNAFYSLSDLVKVAIPDTIQLIQTPSAFTAVSKLGYVDIYAVQGNNLPKDYLSIDGVIVKIERDEFGDESGRTLAYYPKAKAGEYIIPEKITTIASSLFGGAAFSKITIPNCITEIGSNAFQNCLKLSEIVFEPGGKDSLKIYGGVFSSCSLLQRVELPARLIDFSADIFRSSSVEYVGIDPGNDDYKSIEGVVFTYDGYTLAYYPIGKSGDYVIPAGVKNIGVDAFKSNSRLTGITITKSVVSIGKSAFYSSGIRFVTFSGGRYDNLVIGESVFSWCGSLQTITFEDGCKVTEIGDNAFNYSQKFTSINLPDSITKIGVKAFYECKLEELTIHEGVTTIGDGAFYKCSVLYSINIPERATPVEAYTLTLPESVTTVGNEAFLGCLSFKSIIIPKGLESLGSSAFSGCTDITSLTIMELTKAEREAGGVDKILRLGNLAFTKTSIGGTVYLPDRVRPGAGDTVANYTTTFGTGNTGIFYEVNTLSAILVNTTHPGLLTEDGILFTKDFSAMLYYPALRIGDFEIPETVTSLASNVFKDKIGLTSVTIHKNVTHIGASAFENSGIKTATFEEGGTEPLYIGGFTISSGSIVLNSTANGLVFKGTPLTSIKLPARTHSIPNQTFMNCTMLETVEFEEGFDITRIGDEAFRGCSSLLEITIPKNVKYFGQGNSSLVNPVVTDMDKHETSAATNYVNSGNSIFRDCVKLQKVTFEEGSILRTIGEYVFAGCTNLTQLVDFPMTIELIASYAFQNSGIVNITIPKITKGIGQKAFEGTANLYEVKFQKGKEAGEGEENEELAPLNLGGYVHKVGTSTTNTTVTGTNLFLNSGLQKIEIPARAIKLDAYTFDGCTKLVDISFEEGCQITRIYEYTFRNCKMLEEITLPKLIRGTRAVSAVIVNRSSSTPNTARVEEVPGLGNYAFTGCSGLKRVYFEEGCELERIGNYAFAGTVSLEEIVLPDKLETIGNAAFQNSGINEIHIPSSIQSYVTYGITTTSPYAYVLQIVEGISTQFSSSTFIGSFVDSKIQNVYIDQANPEYYDADGVVYTKHNRYVLDTTETVNKGLITETTFVGYSLAFYSVGRTALTYEIPKTTTHIANAAFQSATHLTELTFEDCENTELPDLDIGSYVGTTSTVYSSCIFKGSGLQTITLPSRLSYLAPGAFDAALKLEHVFFAPENRLEKIQDFTFRGIPNLKELEIPKSVKFMGTNVSLTTNTATGDQYVSSGTTYIFSKTGVESITFEEGSQLEIIGDAAFGVGSLSSGPSKLKNIIIPKSVKHIGYYAFGFCADLETITFEEDSELISIGGYAFMDTTSLETIDFSPCKKLTTIVYTNTFRGSGVIDLTLPSNLVNVYSGNGATATNTKLNSDANIANFITSHFGLTKRLENINVKNHPYISSNEGVLFNKDGTRLVYFPSARAETYEIPVGTKIIGAHAFDWRASTTDQTSASFEVLGNLKKVIVPNTVTRIENYAFQNTVGLREVVFEKGGTLPGTNDNLVFGTTDTASSSTQIFRASGLAKVEIPARTTIIGANTFSQIAASTSIAMSEKYYQNLTEITFEQLKDGEGKDIKGRLRTIGTGAFQNNSKLETITLPDGVTEIGANLFTVGANFAQRKLKSVVLPDSITAMGNSTFEGSVNLITANIPDNATLKEIPSSTFSECTKLDNINLPRGITAIGANAFKNTAIHGEIDLPGGVLSIGEAAFINTAITAIDLSNVTNIGTSAFWNTNIKSVTLCENMTTLGAGAFGYTDIASVIIPKTVTILNEQLFDGCGELTTAELHDGITRIGNFAFRDCVNLKNITLPPYVTKLGFGAFQNCKKLPAMSIHSEIKNMSDSTNTSTSVNYWGNPFAGVTSITSIPIEANQTNFVVVDGVLFNSSMTILVAYPAGRVGPYIVPASVVSIARYAFAGAAYLTEVTLPKTLVDICHYAFAYSGITKVNIPSTVKYVYDYAFYGCEQLSELIFDRRLLSTDTMTSWGTGYTFAYTTSLGHVDWSPYLTLPTRAFYGSGIESITLPSTLTSLGAAFAYTTNLKHFDWPSTVTSGENAFMYSALESVYIADGASISSKDVFLGCDKLTDVRLPAGTSLGSGTGIFRDCTGLESIDIPGSYTSFATETFMGCTGLKNVNFLDSGSIADLSFGANTVAMTAGGVFRDCTDLVSITLPDRVKIIASNTFNGCINLETVVANGITMILASAFEGCVKLKNFTLPDTLATIRSRAFAGCTGFVEIILPALAGTIYSSNLYTMDDSIFDGWLETQTIKIKFAKQPEEWNEDWALGCGTDNIIWLLA